jgi:small GTP-binding protein
MKISKKIVLLGHFGVGKTSLIRRFIDNEFETNYQVTIGVQVKKKEVAINKDRVTLMIWDIEGNTSLKKMRSSYLLGSSGFIYVFDLSRPETYENLSSELSYLNEKFPNLPILTIGNKEDLVNSEDLNNYFKKQNIPNLTFSSAKTGDNVTEMFRQISQLLLSNES